MDDKTFDRFLNACFAITIVFLLALMIITLPFLLYYSDRCA